MWNRFRARERRFPRRLVQRSQRGKGSGARQRRRGKKGCAVGPMTQQQVSELVIEDWTHSKRVGILQGDKVRVVDDFTVTLSCGEILKGKCIQASATSVAGVCWGRAQTLKLHTGRQPSELTRGTEQYSPCTTRRWKHRVLYVYRPPLRCKIISYGNQPRSKSISLYGMGFIC